MPPRSKARRKSAKDLLYYERLLKEAGCDLVVGVDEAGRGPLAGPVVAAAVALKTSRFKNRIDDSKKLTFQARGRAFGEITRKSIFGVSVVSEKVIDRINIFEATRQAMREAVRSLAERIAGKTPLNIHVIIDGRMSLKLDWPSTEIINGDGKSKSIAAA
ncbi:MAG: ribonuclease HII, partial [Candidatus Omnitrophota bacterium]